MKARSRSTHDMLHIYKSNTCDKLKRCFWWLNLQWIAWEGNRADNRSQQTSEAEDQKGNWDMIIANECEYVDRSRTDWMRTDWNDRTVHSTRSNHELKTFSETDVFHFSIIVTDCQTHLYYNLSTEKQKKMKKLKLLLGSRNHEDIIQIND